MKKTIAILLAATMMLTFASCSGNKEEIPEIPTKFEEPSIPEEPEIIEEKSGGWNIAEEFYANVPEEIAAVVEGGNATYNGLPMAPVAVLGTQLVAGRNYMVLCSRDNAKGGKELRVATIFADLEGNYQMTYETAFDIATVLDVTDGTSLSGEVLLGGWNYYSENNAGELPEDLKAKFDGALEGMLGANYTPIAYLGSQVVAGANHVFLCSAVPVSENPTTDIVLVKIYSDLGGNSSVSSVTPIPLTFFTKLQ